MSEQHGSLLIEPSLFAYIIEVADALEAEEIPVDDEVRGNDRLVLFLENFVTQFAAKVLGVRLPGLTNEALEEWVAQRHGLETRPDTEVAQRLMYALERTFTVINELNYSGGDSDRASFRLEYVPEILDLIAEWATSWPDLDSRVPQAVSRALQRYNDAIGV